MLRMKQLRRFALSLAVTLPLLAQPSTATLITSVQPALAIVDAGAATTFRTELRNPGEVQATDVRIVYSADGNATIERLDGHDLYTCTNSRKDRGVHERVRPRHGCLYRDRARRLGKRRRVDTHDDSHGRAAGQRPERFLRDAAELS